LSTKATELLVPLPTYPLYTAVIREIGAQARYYRTDPHRDWQPTRAPGEPRDPRTRVLVTIDPNNPTGAVYPPAVRRALLDVADEHGLTILGRSLRRAGFDGPVPARHPRSRRGGDFAVESLEGVPRAGLAAAGLWSAQPRASTRPLAAMKKLADGRRAVRARCSMRLSPR